MSSTDNAHLDKNQGETKKKEQGEHEAPPLLGRNALDDERVIRVHLLGELQAVYQKDVGHGDVEVAHILLHLADARAHEAVLLAQLSIRGGGGGREEMDT